MFRRKMYVRVSALFVAICFVFCFLYPVETSARYRGYNDHPSPYLYASIAAGIAGVTLLIYWLTTRNRNNDAGFSKHSEIVRPIRSIADPSMKQPSSDGYNHSKMNVLVGFGPARGGVAGGVMISF